MMTKKQDTVTYELKKGNEVLYVGITNNPDRREQEYIVFRQLRHKIN